jgi:hypothetical protein
MNVLNVNKGFSEKHVIRDVHRDVNTTCVSKTLVTVFVRKIIWGKPAVIADLIKVKTTVNYTVHNIV